MRRRILWSAALGLTGCLLLILGVFTGLSWYYRDTFAVNTWINGVYCTGLTIDEANAELLRGAEAPLLVLRDLQGREYVLDLADAGYQADYREALGACLEGQWDGQWTDRLLSPQEGEELPVTVSWDGEKLEEMILALPFVQEERERPAAVSILPAEGGWELIDGTRHRLSEERLLKALRESLKRELAADSQRGPGESPSLTVDLADWDCYEDRPDTPEDRRTRERYERLQAFLKGGPVYDMGAEKVEFSPVRMGEFLEKDGEGMPAEDLRGNFRIRREAVLAFVDRLGDAYDTAGTVLSFTATGGDQVEVPYVTYGTLLDREAETEYLTKALEALGRGEPLPERNHIPQYLQQGFVRGRNDIGDTYIEVDMTRQMLYYYVEGELALESEVVTGSARRRMDTPEGVNYVYDKERNRTLRGADYATFVRYWMPVIRHVGLHDASWRGSFGGEIYKTGGSHGCINLPPEAAARLYELVEIGTPVITFYIPEP